MPCYHWDTSLALERYSCGDIIAFGKTLDEAKDNARAAFDRHLRNRFEWLFWSCQDENDREEIRQKWERFEQDMKREPKIVSDAILIEGSE